MELKISVPRQDYKVLVRCFTFNQSKYIEDTLNGFVMQKTDFPYVCVIVDDSSTDGEQELIKAYINKEFEMAKSEEYETGYANITIAPHKSNPNCTFIVFFLKYNHYSKKQRKSIYLQPWRECSVYEAICEGDDYWVRSDKLQMQVDFLDSHPECQYVFTARYVDDENKHTRTIQRYKKRAYTTHDILSGFNPGIQNVCYRVDLTKNFVQYWGINSDRLIPYCASLIGTIDYIDEITSVYRITGEGVSTSIKKEDWFRHAATDFYRFHSVCKSKDKKAYKKGMANYLNAINLPKRQLWKYPSVIYRIIKPINPDLRLVDCYSMVYYWIIKTIKRTLRLTDIKEN